MKENFEEIMENAQTVVVNTREKAIETIETIAKYLVEVANADLKNILKLNPSLLRMEFRDNIYEVRFTITDEKSVEDICIKTGEVLGLKHQFSIGDLKVDDCEIYRDGRGIVIRQEKKGKIEILGYENYYEVWIYSKSV